MTDKWVLTIRTNPPFRLLYDLRWMELGRAGGVEQATYELVDAIGRLDRKNAYRVFAPRSAAWEWDFPPRFNVSRAHSDEGEPYGGFDLVHSTCSYIDPDLMRHPGVLTIHDLQHLHYPEFFAPDDWKNREKLYRDSAARALHIICISEFTRRDVHERYGVPLEKMTTVWNIPSSGVWREIPVAKRRDLVKRMGVDGPFLFYPAHCWPHKNHERLVEAFGRALAQLPADMKLVLTGSPFASDHPALALLQRRGLASRVLHLGYRSPLEIRSLFQECLALVFPSMFEGFGMPVAEAIIAGKPVACSSVTSLPEIAGDAALLFDPLDVDDMSARIVEIATDAGLRERLATAARDRRRVFSTQSSAVKTMAVYEFVYAAMSARS